MKKFAILGTKPSGTGLAAACLRDSEPESSRGAVGLRGGHPDQDPVQLMLRWIDELTDP